MVTNESFTAARHATHVSDGESSLGFIAAAMLRVRQSPCALHGHDSLLHFEGDRMFLQCTSCGHETPGWEVGGDVRPQVRFRGAKRRVPVPHLVGARKIA